MAPQPEQNDWSAFIWAENTPYTLDQLVCRHFGLLNRFLYGCYMTSEGPLIEAIITWFLILALLFLVLCGLLGTLERIYRYFKPGPTVNVEYFEYHLFDDE